ncbi:MAG: hypothetical protein AAF609_23535 [Cyanobacteria bacterium P01_C01_bin.120]
MTSLDSLAGDDTDTGGAGADQFVLALHQGVNTITDFEIGVDQVILSGLTPEGVKLVTANENTLIMPNSDELLGVIQGVTGLDNSIFG